MDFWIQAIGIVAMVMNIIAFQFKSKRNILLCMVAGSALFSVNMFMLGAVLGGIMNALGVIRTLIYIKKDRLPIPIKAVTAVFIAAYLVAYALSFTLFGTEPTVRNFILELLPVIGMSAMTITLSGDNAKVIRLSALISSPCWLTYNILNFTVGGILCEIFGLISVISSIIRIDILGKKDEDGQKRSNL